MMAGYFRQLVDSIQDPMPGLRPLPNALATQADDPAFALDGAPSLPPPERSAPQHHPVARLAQDATFAGVPAEREVPMRDRVASPPRTLPADSDTPRRNIPPPQSEPEVADVIARRIETPLPAAQAHAPPAASGTVRTSAAAIQRDSRKASPAPKSALPRAAPRPNAVRPPTVRSRDRQNAFVNSGETDTSTEVHIHIGRIELTAAAPSKAVRREPSATRKPMSLDDYLQQRGRKSP